MRKDVPPIATDTAPSSSESLAGDFAPLSSAIGSPDALAPLTDLARILAAPRPTSIAGVRQFLARYRDQLLSGVELPAIQSAYEHARKGEYKELLALDRRLADQFGSSDFAAASRHTGRTQLRRLRPLRDRTLQRYIAAVEKGDASGWHVIVFGVLLALFSLPVRQGLLHYAQKTQGTVLDSATIGIPMSPRDREQLEADTAQPLIPAIQSLVTAVPLTPA